MEFKHFRWKVLAIVAMLMFLPYTATCEVFPDKPDWVNGKLYMTVLGSREKQPTRMEMDTYIMCFDFDRDSIMEKKVPDGSYLVRDYENPGFPLVASKSLFYQFDEVANEFTLDPGILMQRIIMDDGAQPMYPDLAQNTYDCIHVVAVKSIWPREKDEQGVFYLRNGVSEQGELETQFVSSRIRDNDGTPNMIYDRYPTKKLLYSWECDISPDGYPVWTDDGFNLEYFDGKEIVTIYKEETGLTKTFSQPCWKDDHTILYFCKTWSEDLLEDSDSYLTAWDTNTREEKIMLDKNGNAFLMKRSEYASIASSAVWFTTVDSTGKLLYTLQFKESGPEFVFVASIVIYNLETGEQYEYRPWPDHVHYIGTDGKNYSFQYTKTERGVYLSQPIETSATQIAWGQ